jgi:p-aminobenzoyl-glutamate transporter AbgT
MHVSIVAGHAVSGSPSYITICVRVKVVYTGDCSREYMDLFKSLILIIRVVYLIVTTIEGVICNDKKTDKKIIENIIEIIFDISEFICSLPTLNMEAIVSYNSLTS